MTKFGEILTFYSYKGGVGCSMALANVAWILASNGYSVLVIDWNLDSPGLHRYFAPFLSDPQLVSTGGLIDFCFDFASARATSGKAPPRHDWNLWRYAVSLNWQGFPGNGQIDFIPAGRQGPDYATRVSGFDWRIFYERLGGQELFDTSKQRMRDEYDYVLIDSHTGVTDANDICTIQMPDKVALFFSYNNQSIEGAAGVASNILAQRTPPIALFPVPTRSDAAEKAKLERARSLAQAIFQSSLQGRLAFHTPDYWGAVEIPYVPFYAYEETLAAFGDDSFSQTSLLAATERLTFWLTDGLVARLPIIPQEQRLEILARFSRAKDALLH